MVRHTARAFVVVEVLHFVLLRVVELLSFVPFSVERSDLMGGPRGAEPP